ncbi:MAG: hypothetical protein Kow00127_11190 [Bacteroidales bacterium]
MKHLHHAKLFLLMTLLALTITGLQGQIISQYVEANSGSNPKGIEIWNNTSGTLDFSTNNLVIEKGSNGSTPTPDYTLSSGTLASGEVLVIGTSDLQTVTQSNGSAFYTYSFSFNGNDALVVKYGGTVTDVFGEPGVDPGSAWTGNGVSTLNQNIALLSGITTGDTDGWSDPSLRFETISIDPSGGGVDGFGLAPAPASSPTVQVNPASLSGFGYSVGNGPSASQSFDVTGSNLTADITITPPADYEISSDNVTFQSTAITLTQSDGSAGPATYYTRLKAGLATGTYNESITVSSTGATSLQVSLEGSVYSGEPSNHPTNFTATAQSFETITLTWTDSDGSGYLVKGSDAGYSSIADPVDGVAESDGLLVKNVAAGVQSCTFNGLAPATTYYFKIYTYNGSGATINYLTTAPVPEASATTQTLENAPDVIINEVDSDTPGTDALEFVEIYDHGVGNTDLTGCVVVFFNGNGDVSYAAFDLDGYSTDANGYFVLGNSAVNGVDLVFNNNFLQNGADAVAIYFANDTDFPNGTPVTTANLIDALVYDTNEPDDAGLLVLLNSGEPQVDESGSGNSSAHSNQRIVNGSGGARNTSTYRQAPPTPDAPNQLLITWDGSSNSDWTNTSNWDNQVPDAQADVVIPDVSAVSGNFPVISTTETCKSLTIDAGASLDIGVTGRLTVSNSMVNNGQLNLLADATGSASLIEPSGVQANVQAYVGSSAWHFVAPPVDNANTGVFTGLYMQWWDETTGTWEWVLSADSTLATDMQGYSVWSNSNTTLSYTGTLNAGSRSIALTYTTGTAYLYPGYNLVGNPYPSGIDWDAATGWTKTNVDNAIYAWTGSQYASYVNSVSTNGLTNELPPHQGFFVHCSGTGGGTLGVNDAARIHTSQTNLKGGLSIDNLLKLEVTSFNGSDQTAIYTQTGASPAFDSDFDAYKMNGSANTPQLYTLSAGNEHLSINALPALQKPVVLALEPGTEGLFELKIAETTGLEAIPVWLEDTKENKIINLKTSGGYKFFASTDDAAERFILHFGSMELPVAEGNSNGESLAIYGSAGKVFWVAGQEVSGTMIVNDLTGRTVAIKEISRSSAGSVSVNVPSGIYIIRVSDGKELTTQKVFIR